jgi:hypothetical protein
MGLGVVQENNINRWSHTYLFTFWPPGPEDLLKVNSPKDSRGMVRACTRRSASHARAASRPLSAPSAGERVAYLYEYLEKL